ncbi:hypothetical protein [Aliiruegeria haliotis]|nr:hypothetical protein [Aliiruegeria haliotis]
MSLPVTEHERAYMRYLEVIAQATGADEVVHPPRQSVSPLNLAMSFQDSGDVCRNSGFDWFGNVGGKVRDSTASAKAAALKSSAYAMAILADRDLAREIGNWTGDAFNNLSNVYTKAMDAKFLEENLEAVTHRITDEGHSFLGSLEKVRAALPDDTFTQEFVGWFRAYTSDMSSVAGMPLFSIGQDTLANLVDVAERVGISRDWLLDSATFSLEEFVTSALPGLAVLLNWDEADKAAFLKMLGGLAVYSAVAANPISAAVLLVGLARAHQNMKLSGADRQQRFGQFCGGGVRGGLVTLMSMIVGGPVWIGLVAGVLLAMMAQRELEGTKIDFAQLARLARNILGASLKGAGLIAAAKG